MTSEGGKAAGDVVREARPAILAEASDRVCRHDDMLKVAEQRGLTGSELAAQVLGFWLDAVQTDLDLACTTAVEGNLAWLSRLREGHGLPFGNASVHVCFSELSRSIEARLTCHDQQAEFAEYKRRVEALIEGVFRP
jgi:hypothetical protein